MMKFLVDADLPNSTVEALRDAGFEAVHVREIGLCEEKADVCKAGLMYKRAGRYQFCMTIVRNEKIRVGKPVIEGSRVAVEDVVESFYERKKSTGEVAEAYGITEDQVEEALRYYHRSQDSEPVEA